MVMFVHLFLLYSNRSGGAAGGGSSGVGGGSVAWYVSLLVGGLAGLVMFVVMRQL